MAHRTTIRIIGLFAVAAAILGLNAALARPGSAPPLEKNPPFVDVGVPDPAPGTDEGSADAAPAAAPLPIHPPRIIGLSKNLCEGNLINGHWMVLPCQPNPAVPPTRTLVGRQALLRLFVRNNPETCGPEGNTGPRCDQAAELNGPLAAQVDFRIRLGPPCLTRGSWNGGFHLSGAMLPVILAQGEVGGTLGVGTHRMGVCAEGTPPGPCGPACESCSMAHFDPNTNRWRFHVEGLLRGLVSAGPNLGGRIHASLSGEFSAPGDANGPVPPNVTATGWLFCGRLDGVVELPCESNTGP